MGIHLAKNPNATCSLETRDNCSHPILWISKKMRAPVLAPSKNLDGHNIQTEKKRKKKNQKNRKKRPGQQMNFNRLTKSKFQGGGEVLSLWCWMDVVPQILVAPHLEISSLAWKHLQACHGRLSVENGGLSNTQLDFRACSWAIYGKTCPQSAFNGQENYCGNCGAERKKLK